MRYLVPPINFVWKYCNLIRIIVHYYVNNNFWPNRSKVPGKNRCGHNDTNQNIETIDHIPCAICSPALSL